MARNRRQPLQNPNVQGVVVLSSVIAIALLFVLNNRQAEQEISAPIPQPTQTNSGLADWQIALQQNLSNLPTATLAPALQISPFVPPTLPGITETPESFSAANIAETAFPSSTPFPTVAFTLTPFFANSTPLPLPTGAEIAALPIDENPEQFQLPPELVPLSAQPNDHFWLTRPLNVSANSQSLFYYPYGSSGQGWRVHHGLDMPNPPGEEVLAAGSGTVVWAGNRDDLPPDESAVVGDLQVYPSYGNFVVIEHDFGWQGQKVWTLYAHMSAILVQFGERVETGKVIGLVGASGNVTGPHVHFEVRVGIDEYYSTRNPMLWMAPYIGHGVVAGQVLDAEGEFIEGALVQLNRAGRVSDQTTTYINPFEEGKRIWNVVPDDNWNENFVLGDIPAGEYQIVVTVNNERLTDTIEVQAGITTFVQLRLDFAATPQAFVETPIIPTAIFLTPVPTAIPSTTPGS